MLLSEQTKRHFWNLVTGDLVTTENERVISCLLDDGYVEVTEEQFRELAEIRLDKI